MLMRHAGVALVAIAAVFAVGCFGGDDAEAQAPGMPPPPPVATATALRQVVADPLLLTGRFVATEHVDLRPQVSGQIIEVLVEDGAQVTAGDVVMRLEDATLRANVAQAEANLQRAKAEVIVAQQRFDRSEPLVEQKILSQQAVDDAGAALAVAQAARAAADASLTAAQVDLAYANITAPISGRIGRVLATTGNVVQAGMTPLLSIVRDDDIDIRFDLAEKQWLEHAARLQAAVAGEAEVGISVHAGSHIVPAQLHMIDNAADAQAGVVRLYARLQNPSGIFLPGVFARIEVTLTEPEERLLIHEAAVTAQLNSRFVYTVDENGITALAPVQLGARLGVLRVVESGLDGTEQIAVTNLKKIFFPGAPVSPLPGDMATASPAASPSASPGPGPETAPATPANPADETADEPANSEAAQ